MKLSEIKDEQAIDILADIMEPACNILADDEVQKAYKANVTKVRLVKIAIKNHKKEVIEIMARLDGEDPENYHVSLVTLPMKLLEILNDREVMSLFRSQGQIAQPSGSATGNTEGKEN